jgi:hypothetical protein
MDYLPESVIGHGEHMAYKHSERLLGQSLPEGLFSTEQSSQSQLGSLLDDEEYWEI